VSALYLNSKYFRSSVKKSIETYTMQRTREDFFENLYIRVQDLIVISFLSGTIFIFLYLAAFGNVSWIRELVISLSVQLLFNPLMSILFFLIIALTFFYPLIRLLSEWLPVFAKDILSPQVKHRIKFIRAWTLLLLIALLIFKLLPLETWIGNVSALVLWALSLLITSVLTKYKGTLFQK
jgi:hypothetical protein